VREGVIGGAHHRLSSFIIITHRSPSRTSGHQRRSTSISDHHRPVAPNGDRVRAPASALAFIISRHRQGASVIVTHPRCHHLPPFRSRAGGTVSITSSANLPPSGIEAAHRSMAVTMGRTHRAVAAAPSRRLLVADG
jgi:hypothetical protein